jgi:hypothetical protein
MSDEKIITRLHQLKSAHSIVVPGFESDLTGFTVVFENSDKIQMRHPVNDTSMGYFNDNISGFERVWFEYERSPRDYEIIVHLI